MQTKRNRAGPCGVHEDESAATFPRSSVVSRVVPFFGFGEDLRRFAFPLV
jgi:hypothetical protein